MRLFIFLLLIASSVNLQAALVTFEDVTATSPCGYGAPVPCLDSIATQQGFVFADTAGPGAGEIYVTNNSGSDGNFITTAAFPDDGANIKITHQSGQAFDLQSLDVYVSAQNPAGGPGGAGVRAYDAANNMLAYLWITNPEGGWVTTAFDDSWNSAHSVVVEGDFFCTFGCAWTFPQLDNVTASVVPVPAAVWLFGSALAGLGWFRRKTA